MFRCWRSLSHWRAPFELYLFSCVADADTKIVSIAIATSESVSHSRNEAVTIGTTGAIHTSQLTESLRQSFGECVVADFGIGCAA